MTHVWLHAFTAKPSCLATVMVPDHFTSVAVAGAVEQLLREWPEAVEISIWQDGREVDTRMREVRRA